MDTSNTRSDGSILVDRALYTTHVSLQQHQLYEPVTDASANERHEFS